MTSHGYAFQGSLMWFHDPLTCLLVYRPTLRFAEDNSILVYCTLTLIKCTKSLVYTDDMFQVHLRCPLSRSCCLVATVYRGRFRCIYRWGLCVLQINCVQGYQVILHTIFSIQKSCQFSILRSRQKYPVIVPQDNSSTFFS